MTDASILLHLIYGGLHMRTSRVPAKEQYHLIMECRQSGLSDQQWCLNHDIKPGTFYNWVKRLRQKGYRDIPAPAGKTSLKSLPQEVVKIEIAEPAGYKKSLEQSSVTVDSSSEKELSEMELIIGNARLHIPNGTDPFLVSQVIRALKEFLC